MNDSFSPSPARPETRFAFCGLRIDANGLLFRGRIAIELPREELLALRVLLAHAGRVVAPAQVRRAAWGDARADSGQIEHCVTRLRTRLGLENCIEILGRRGFRFIGAVRGVEGEPVPSPLRIVLLPLAIQGDGPAYLAPAVMHAAERHMQFMLATARVLRADDSIATLLRRRWSAQQIGRAVGADQVLHGEMSVLPTYLRVHLEMFRASDGQPLWSEVILAPLESGETLGRELGVRICHRVDGISFRRGGMDAEPEGEAHREAYRLLTRARGAWHGVERYQMQDALQRLQRAVELDPELAEARIELVHLCLKETFHGYIAPPRAAELVARFTAAAHSGNPACRELLPAMGWIQYHAERNLGLALRFFSNAQHLPHTAAITCVRSFFALSRRRFGEGIDLLRSALEEDPYSAWIHARLAWTLHLAGDAEASQQQIARALSEFPESEQVALMAALLLAYGGQPARGVEIARDLVRRAPYFDPAMGTLAYALACAGEQEQARNILEQQEWMSRERYVMPTFMAAAYLALGDPEAAIASLAQANSMRCPWLFQMLADPRLAPLRGHPGYEALAADWQALEDSAGDGISASDPA